MQFKVKTSSNTGVLRWIPFVVNLQFFGTIQCRYAVEHLRERGVLNAAVYYRSLWIFKNILKGNLTTFTKTLRHRYPHCVWKVSKYGVFYRRYFLIFSPNMGKYDPQKLRIWTLFTQYTFHTAQISWDIGIFNIRRSLWILCRNKFS